MTDPHPATHSRRRADRTHRSRPADPRLRRPRRLLAAASLAVALLALATVPAVAGGRAGAPTAPAVQAPGAAWIRAGHFVPGFGAGRIDLTPGSGASTGIVMSPDATYGDVTGYQKVAPGPYTVTLRLAGQGTDTAPLLERTFTLTAGSASTVAAIGTLSAPRLSVLTDDLTPPPAGDARVRVLAAASRTPTLTVQAQNGPTLASGAVLGQVTSYTTVPRGAWPLALSGASASASQTVSLAAGTVYTAVVLDTGSTSVAVKLVTDAVGSSALPVGGARTGEGGLVDPAPAAPAVNRAGVALALAGAGAALALAASAARRRPVRVRVRARR
ncbi:DUF4397 domain-containing protein [Lapillicoccus jejuensis]|uniref:Uncharacterized protein DUF4397 n=1 Tax=Lapillicoccus jejuensis TaxID=402171 RepID=A0A542DXH1_9MICO|nr:DUF4397 domain-containing protein [Lapillicoccus jejuensis]TQJ07791.1 uncharacterized protein DUF4397 [Lapillicoccus jejuensis]